VSGNRTPLGGLPLAQPDPAPLRVNAVFDPAGPCLEHQVAYTGQVPYGAAALRAVPVHLEPGHRGVPGLLAARR
jgi:hypothetical protein